MKVKNDIESGVFDPRICPGWKNVGMEIESSERKCALDYRNELDNF